MYFMVWIPFTIGVWQLTRHWLPERFGGWVWLLAAHLPVFTVVTDRSRSRWCCSARRSRTADRGLGRFSHAAARPVERAAADLHGDCRHRCRDYALRAAPGAAARGLAAGSRACRRTPAGAPRALAAALPLQQSPQHRGARPYRDTAAVVRLTAGLSDLLRYVLDAAIGSRAAAARSCRSSSAISRSSARGSPIGSRSRSISRRTWRMPCRCSSCSRSSRTPRHGSAPRVREGSGPGAGAA